MKNILVVSYYSGENTAVGSRRINALNSYLNKNGFNAHIESLKNINNYSPEVQKINSSFRNKISISNYFRTLDKTILKSSFFSIIRKHFYSKNDYNFIIASYKPSWSIILGIILSKIYRSKLILEYRDLASLFGRKKRIFFVHYMDIFLDKIMLSFADHLVVVSPTQKKMLSSITNKDITVIYNGIDGTINNDFKKILVNKKVNVFYGGVLSSSRMLDKIIIYLERNFVDFKLRVGSKNNPSLFGGNHPKVKYLGFLNKDNLESEINNADLLIILEGNNLQSIENIPAKTFEYLKYSKPILLDVHLKSDIMTIINKVEMGINIYNPSKSIFDLTPNYSNLNDFLRDNQFKKYKNLLDEN